MSDQSFTFPRPYSVEESDRLRAVLREASEAESKVLAENAEISPSDPGFYLDPAEYPQAVFDALRPEMQYGPNGMEMD